MTDYIRRNDALEIIKRTCGDYAAAWSEIRKLPTADVAPVVHTRWAHLGGDEWCCPVCGFVITTEGSWGKPTKKILRGLRGQDERTR